MRALAGVAITIAVSAIRADTPLPPLAKVSVISPNGHFRAVSDPRVGTRVENITQNKVLGRFLVGTAAYASVTTASISLRSTMG